MSIGSHQAAGASAVDGLQRGQAGGRARARRVAVEHGINDLYMGAAPALMPFLVAFRGYTYTQAGGVVLAATLLSSLAQPVFGVLADRRSRWWVDRAGLGLAAAGIAVSGLLDSYLAVCAAMVVSGLGAAAYHPEATRAVHRTGTGDTGMSWFSFGGLIGFAAGPALVGGVVAIAGLGATPLLALPAALLLGFSRRRAPDPPHLSALLRPAGPSQARHRERATAADAETSTDTVIEDWRRFGWLTGIVLTRSVLFYGLTAFLAVFLISTHHASPTTAVIGLTLFTGLGALATLAAGPLTARIGRVAVLSLSYLVAVPLLAAVLWLPALPEVLVAAAALGATLNLPVPVHTTLGHQYLPRHIATASSVTLGLAVNAGGLVTPALGALADRSTPATALTSLLGLPLLAAALTVPLRSPHPKRPITERRHPGEPRVEPCRLPTRRDRLSDPPAPWSLFVLVERPAHISSTH